MKPLSKAGKASTLQCVIPEDLGRLREYGEDSSDG